MGKSIPKTLLVVKNRAIGDSVMGLSTIQYLRGLYPESKIYYAIPDWIAPLYKNVSTSADEIIPLNLKTIGDWWKSYKTLRSLKVDHVLELFQSGRTAKFFSLWSSIGGPKYHYHNHHTKEGSVFDQGVIKSNIQRDLDGAWTFFGKGPHPPSFIDYEPKMELKGEPKNQVILGVVATRQTKMWPLEYYGELTHLLKDKDPKTKVIIPLGPGDKEIEEFLSPLIADNTIFLKVSLSEIPLHLCGSKRYIGNDTGLKHICIALGVPTFTLFGPEPPTEWHPYSKERHPYYFRTPLECRTRDAHFCALKSCHSMICLNEFKPLNLLDHI